MIGKGRARLFLVAVVLWTLGLMRRTTSELSDSRVSNRLE